MLWLSPFAMLKKVLFFLILSCSLVRAYDPFLVPNNKIGIHILEPQEIDQAAKLVNTSGGDWGYVTIPMRSDDRDRDKWLLFFKKARQLHLIPIIRLATYADGGTWVRPNIYDLVDFANFLDDMPWPIQNRYIILFNEPNHNNEWGGQVDALSYATLVLDAQAIFKSRSQDFFLLSAGLDMSVPSSASSLDALEFYREMSVLQPSWYSSIDGLAVHAYPNPDFSSSPYIFNRYSISSYKFETNYLARLGYLGKPIFITETGWTNQPGDYYSVAFSQIWTDPNLVTVTPFLLFAGAGDFAKFSILNSSAYLAIQGIPKISGSPLLSNVSLEPASKQVKIRSAAIDIEIADTDILRQQGLSGKQKLDPNSGMLFIFPTADKYSFWMKDMYFPLDFIWIRDNHIVQLTTNVPVQPLKVLFPDQTVDQVLEVNAGFVEKYDIKVGDEVENRYGHSLLR